MIGKTLSHYRITAKLGEGGMGEVYRAEDTKLGREVAIKVLTEDFAGDRDRLSRFQREAKSLAILNHPNIVTIYSVEEYQGIHFLTMELVDGKPLGELIPAAGLNAQELLDLALPLVEALGAAHAKGIIHRDLKPANVMVSDDGRVKILDFGLAKLQPAEVATEELKNLPTLTMTRVGTVMGTAPYMSPEQIEATSIDHRTDIFSLGIVLYEMATGNRPFQGSSSAAVVSSILRDTPRRVTEIKVDLPEQLGTLIGRCLEKQPEDRFLSAGDILDELQVLEQNVVTGEAIVSRAPTTALAHPRSRWIALVAALVILAVIVGVSIWQARLPPPEASAPKIASLAVLPLKNYSGDPEQEYFVDGMTEALITALSKIGALRVISRTSAMRYKGSDKPLPEIAAELGVDALVEGSVVREADQVGIRANLIEASSDSNLWAGDFTRELTSILTLQGEIARAIAREIQIALTPEEEARLAAARPVNPEAFEAYLKGRFHWQKQTQQDLDIAERYFQTALQKDPSYALAYAGIGMVWRMRADAGFQAPSETFPKATAFLAKAIELDDDSAEVHVSLANHKIGVQWDWAGAEKEFQRALELNPNLADAHFFYADLLVVLKRNEEWKREIMRARELDPLNDFKESFYGWHLNYLRRYDEAIPIFQKLLSTGPNKASNYLGLWGAYYRKGIYDEALSAARGYFTTIDEQEFADLLGTGRGESAYRAAMKKVGEAMAAQTKLRHVPAIRIARMFAHAGDKGSAIRWLEGAYQARESPMIRLGVFWDWDDLRSDPRFQSLLHRMNLPSQPPKTDPK